MSIVHKYHNPEEEITAYIIINNGQGLKMVVGQLFAAGKRSVCLEELQTRIMFRPLHIQKYLSLCKSTALRMQSCIHLLGNKKNIFEHL